jgi:hypothetical protein
MYSTYFDNSATDRGTLNVSPLPVTKCIVASPASSWLIADGVGNAGFDKTSMADS